jgi:hypothetical protein
MKTKPTEREKGMREVVGGLMGFPPLVRNDGVQVCLGQWQTWRCKFLDLGCFQIVPKRQSWPTASYIPHFQAHKPAVVFLGKGLDAWSRNP